MLIPETGGGGLVRPIRPAAFARRSGKRPMRRGVLRRRARDRWRNTRRSGNGTYSLCELPAPVMERLLFEYTG